MFLFSTDTCDNRDLVAYSPVRTLSTENYLAKQNPKAQMHYLLEEEGWKPAAKSNSVTSFRPFLSLVNKKSGNLLEQIYNAHRYSTSGSPNPVCSL